MRNKTACLQRTPVLMRTLLRTGFFFPSFIHDNFFSSPFSMSDRQPAFIIETGTGLTCVDNDVKMESCSGWLLQN